MIEDIYEEGESADDAARRWAARCAVAEASVLRLTSACESAMRDLAAHEGGDERGSIDGTERDLRKALGLCLACTDGMEQYGKARITCPACGGSGKLKEQRA